ncbi:MAG: hypothetical protein ACE5K3_09745, partial [bacterium]
SLALIIIYDEDRIHEDFLPPNSNQYQSLLNDETPARLLPILHTATFMPGLLRRRKSWPA